MKSRLERPAPLPAATAPGRSHGLRGERDRLPALHGSRRDRAPHRAVAGLAPAAARIDRFRSINNVVDATNYVLREYGQPIHAFDATKVGGNEIRCGRARAGETLRLLDGRLVTLTPAVQVIADATKPDGARGGHGRARERRDGGDDVGGARIGRIRSGVTRGGARSMGVETDASIRFGQGVDPEGVALALDATARLLAEIGGGAIAAGVVDQWPGKRPERTVRLRLGRMRSLLGMEVEPDEATRALATLEIQPAGDWAPEGGDRAAGFRVPGFRRDLEIEEDLIEEVGRVIGYESVPALLRAAPVAATPEPPEARFAASALDAAGLGFDEVVGPALVGVIPEEAREGLGPDGVWELHESEEPRARSTSA